MDGSPGKKAKEDRVKKARYMERGAREQGRGLGGRVDRLRTVLVQQLLDTWKQVLS